MHEYAQEVVNQSLPLVLETSDDEFDENYDENYTSDSFCRFIAIAAANAITVSENLAKEGSDKNAEITVEYKEEKAGTPFSVKHLDKITYMNYNSNYEDGMISEQKVYKVN